MTAKTFSVGEILSAADVNEYLANGYWKRIDRRIITSGSPSTSVSFLSLSSSFRMFRLTWSTVGNGSSANFLLRLNNDSGANYDCQENSYLNTTQNSLTVDDQTSAPLWQLAAPVVSTGEVIIGKIASNVRGIFHSSCAAYASTYTPSKNWWILQNGSWDNTSALINRIDVLTTAGSFYGTVALEGMVGV